MFGAEQPPEYYDEVFRAANHWRRHYTKSHYYPLWTIIADRIQRAGINSIIDIGCGPGQVANLLRDKGVSKYLGVDFSPARVEQAREVCPDYDFVVADVFETDLLETYTYDCALIMEFLEHVENDLEVLKRIKAGTFMLATVPNFPARRHVRYFNSVDEVRKRYKQCLESIRVDEHLADTKGKKYYILEGYLLNRTNEQNKGVSFLTNDTHS
jgi:SAM-dependent methyltransferase